MSVMSTGFAIVVPLIFSLALGIIVFCLVRGAKEWGDNNRSPRLTVPAQVVARRTRSHQTDNMGSMSSTYYVTFQFESGDRQELQVPANHYGYLVEGDFGRLTFQGTRYLNFERM